MKFQIFIAGLACVFWNSVIAQDIGRLVLEENKLVGQTENPYFTGFEIELDQIYTSIDSSSLFGQLPRVGKINFKNKFEIPTIFSLTERSGQAQIMFTFKNDYLTFDHLEINGTSLTFTIDEDPEVPVTEDDLKIVQLAQKLLSEEKYWHKNDDRNCEDDLADKSYSIYCALRIASLEVENRYNHRNAALQKLRHLIDYTYPNRTWDHRLMDFNNMQETDYQDIVEFLAYIEYEFTLELDKAAIKKQYADLFVRSEKEQKPILFYFTGQECYNAQKMDKYVLNHDEVLKVISKNYLFVALHVDDKTNLDSTILTKKGRTLKTLGHRNAHFQMTYFDTNYQPFFAIMMDEAIVTQTGYTPHWDEFLKFLNSGVED